MTVREFYDDLACDYDAIFADWDAGLRWQAGVIEKLLPVAADPILDVAAGMGTQAIGLALAGHAVVARDLSPALVERGRIEAARLSASLAFEVGDMREACADDVGRFGAAIAFDNALPHLDSDEDLLAALRASKAALRPGGRLLASIRDYDALVLARPTIDPPRLLGSAPSRRLILQVWRWADDGGSYEFDHILLRETDAGWSARTRRTRYRALRRSTLEAMAHAAGFEVLRWVMPEESGYYQPIFIAE